MVVAQVDAQQSVIHRHYAMPTRPDHKLKSSGTEVALGGGIIEIHARRVKTASANDVRSRRLRVPQRRKHALNHAGFDAAVARKPAWLRTLGIERCLDLRQGLP